MWLQPDVWKNLPVLPLVTAIICLGGCTNQPTEEQLEIWRNEAIARNAEIVADNAKKNQPMESNLVIQGETATGKSVKFNWQQVGVLANTYVQTTDPNYVIDRNQVFNFRGLPISKLLKEFGHQSNVTEVTFLSDDAYQITVSLADLLTYPIILAIANNGKPINRDQGGPIYLVFPYRQYPEIKQKYDESFWAFYVSNMIVGTEKVQLRVGKRTLNLAALDQLPQVTLTETVGYRIGWPSGKVKLHGVRVRDVLSLAGVQLPTLGEVVVRGKAQVYRSTANPMSFSAADLRECEILLVTRWGEDKQLIPAKLGGPVTLAFSSECKTKTSNIRWVTFVEELIIQP
ncbi:molybdopterin-dependent oxidoreductase [Cylindrospermum sp. FACHB-282]|uniref:molybdopterin-dependent oxidoreductase n=1 Tax=Cylindrospermum sp. FACHB-282 TaxID=2692794 RepID=UPI00168476BE|nr:molybdopterin-dependent oxidoreductase [Cylindrospermum sp. FACHB-282]MBD2388010.1 molybdopterin-dependent oxidoreductase [Cylindrospermum sp. FACHB-282]